MVAMFVNGSGQNVQSLESTFYRCFLPSFSSFDWGVSEEKIKMWKVNGRRTPSDGKSSGCNLENISNLYTFRQKLSTTWLISQISFLKINFTKMWLL